MNALPNSCNIFAWRDDISKSVSIKFPGRNWHKLDKNDWVISSRTQALKELPVKSKG